MAGCLDEVIPTERRNTRSRGGKGLSFPPRLGRIDACCAAAVERRAFRRGGQRSLVFREGPPDGSSLPGDAPWARCARYDLPLIFTMIAPSTIRSRNAIASGGSPRYSPHASKS